ncbi:tRNA (adenine-N(1)-)-methyltransferase non-catalytic subunit [Angomonas deanei]|nr:tRNA (adenine-N(1)-)-methyltransferase non-catalytic subunit [Angomonas deanei]|eukprot:EPY24400.1 tRNA (adenine-N(1)-)-methyltransferase non-catalytic subunit [Angomonas deanei]
MTDRIKEGDFVFVSGGGSKRLVEVKKGQVVRMGRSGAANALTLVGMRFGEVVSLDHNQKKFSVTNAYPDLDLSEISKDEAEVNDNRNLVDDNRSQQLSKEEVAAIRKEKGVDELLNTLVQKSTTFESKTSFSKEKYLRKKKKKYGTLFKLERPAIDNIAETHLPTINPSDDLPDDARSIRLRTDTVALLLHYGNICYNSRVLVYDRTNGSLEGYVLSRLGEEGQLFQVLDQNAQPNTFTASKMMGLDQVKQRWKAIPRNRGFLLGEEEEERPTTTTSTRPVNEGQVSQWIKGTEARQLLLEKPVDSLLVVDDENPEKAMDDLFPFLAPGGHLVVYSPFLEDLTPLFLKFRNSCININISETWYRHHQVLPQRTHPTVNMSTAAGYLLTAIKVPPNPAPRPRFAEKRPRDEGEEEETA